MGRHDSTDRVAASPLALGGWSPQEGDDLLVGRLAEVAVPLARPRPWAREPPRRRPGRPRRPATRPSRVRPRARPAGPPPRPGPAATGRPPARCSPSPGRRRRPRPSARRPSLGAVRPGSGPPAGRPRPTRRAAMAASWSGDTPRRASSPSLVTTTPSSPTAPTPSSGRPGAPSLRTTATSSGAPSARATSAATGTPPRGMAHTTGSSGRRSRRAAASRRPASERSRNPRTVPGSRRIGVRARFGACRRARSGIPDSTAGIFRTRFLTRSLAFLLAADAARRRHPPDRSTHVHHPRRARRPLGRLRDRPPP